MYNFTIEITIGREHPVLSLLVHQKLFFFSVADGEAGITARHHRADELDRSHGEHHRGR